MAEESLKEIAELELPFRRRARVREVTFDSGLRMVRLILIEGKRITQVDMDADSARHLAEILTVAAEGSATDTLQ